MRKSGFKLFQHKVKACLDYISIHSPVLIPAFEESERLEDTTFYPHLSTGKASLNLMGIIML